MPSRSQRHKTAQLLSAGYVLPGQPTAVAGTPGDGEVSVAYTPGASVGYTQTFEVQYKLATDFSWQIATNSDAATPLVVAGLTNDLEYNFRVRGVNAWGGGAWSATASATPAEA